jgi:hypothetical protein
MTEFASNITDRSTDPSQGPLEIVFDADGVLGMQPGKALGVSGNPEAELPGNPTVPLFGFAGSWAGADDAEFVPSGNDVGAASQWMPGQRFSLGYQNEAHAREGVIVEANLIIQDRPIGVTPDVSKAMGL